MSAVPAAQSLSGKIAIVTGASSGIGEATSRVFAERGAQVVFVAGCSNGLSNVADEIAPPAAWRIQSPLMSQRDLIEDGSSLKLRSGSGGSTFLSMVPGSSHQAP